MEGFRRLARVLPLQLQLGSSILLAREWLDQYQQHISMIPVLSALTTQRQRRLKTMGIKVKFNHWWLWKKFCLANCKEGQEQERQKSEATYFYVNVAKITLGMGCVCVIGGIVTPLICKKRCNTKCFYFLLSQKRNIIDSNWGIWITFGAFEHSVEFRGAHFNFDGILFQSWNQSIYFMEFCGVKGKEFSFRCSNYTNFSNKFGYFKFITLLLKIDRFVIPGIFVRS